MAVTHETVLRTVASLWNTPPWPPESQALFLSEIKNMSADRLLAAARRRYREDPSGFRPTPGQLCAGAVVPIQDAERAWVALRNAVEWWGKKPDGAVPDTGMARFADERIPEALGRMGGFIALLASWRDGSSGWDMPTQERWRLAFLRAYCGEAYEQPAQLGRTREHLQLPAEIESKLANFFEGD